MTKLSELYNSISSGENAVSFSTESRISVLEEKVSRLDTSTSVSTNGILIIMELIDNPNGFNSRSSIYFNNIYINGSNGELIPKSKYDFATWCYSSDYGDYLNTAYIPINNNTDDSGGGRTVNNTSHIVIKFHEEIDISSIHFIVKNQDYIGDVKVKYEYYKCDLSSISWMNKERLEWVLQNKTELKYSYNDTNLDTINNNYKLMSKFFNIHRYISNVGSISNTINRMNGVIDKIDDYQNSYNKLESLYNNLKRDDSDGYSTIVFNIENFVYNTNFGFDLYIDEILCDDDTMIVNNDINKLINITYGSEYAPPNYSTINNSNSTESILKTKINCKYSNYGSKHIYIFLMLNKKVKIKSVKMRAIPSSNSYDIYFLSKFFYVDMETSDLSNYVNIMNNFNINKKLINHSKSLPSDNLISYRGTSAVTIINNFEVNSIYIWDELNDLRGNHKYLKDIFNVSQSKTTEYSKILAIDFGNLQSYNDRSMENILNVDNLKILRKDGTFINGDDIVREYSYIKRGSSYEFDAFSYLSGNVDPCIKLSFPSSSTSSMEYVYFIEFKEYEDIESIEFEAYISSSYISYSNVYGLITCYNCNGLTIPSDLSLNDNLWNHYLSSRVKLDCYKTIDSLLFVVYQGNRSRNEISNLNGGVSVTTNRTLFDEVLDLKRRVEALESK